MKRRPTVSVIIPTYNRRDYVQEAIDSVLAQTYTDYEIIVVDDGSTDGTCEALQGRYGERIRYVCQENQGESVARNRGIEMARGEYVAFLDSDDLWLPHKLERQVERFGEASDVSVLLCQSWLIGPSGERISERPFGANRTKDDFSLASLCMRNTVSGPSTVMVSRETLHRVGGFDASIHYGEDWDLWLRLRQLGCFDVIQEPLACIRRHEETQCYYPTDGTATRLADHITVLNKLFQSWKEPEAVELRERALARQYADAFLSHLAAGDSHAAAKCLDRVPALDEGLLRDLDSFGQHIVDTAAVIAEPGTRRAHAEAYDYVNRVLHLLSGNCPPRFRRGVLARASAMLAYLSREGTPRSPWPYLLRELWYDPFWAARGGVGTALVRAVIAPGVYNALRKTARRILGGS